MSKQEMIAVIAKAYFPDIHLDQTPVMCNWRAEMYRQNSKLQLLNLHEVAIGIIKDRI